LVKQRELLNDRWEVQRELGRGGQGRVYLVKATENSGIYAAKVFEIKGYEGKKLARARTEIEAIKKLKGSAHIVQIYDENISTVEDGVPVQVFYVMDYARHGSLDNNDFYLGDVQQCLRLFKQILIGVRNAHAKGVIHRDLKPGNVLLMPTQRDVVINDFGLGLLKDRDLEAAVTEQDEVVGPRYFMSPEQQLRPSEADERSDIYSLGKVLYYMLTGKGKLYREKLDDINEALSEPNPYIPQIQSKLLNKMVAEKQDDRFSDVNEIIDELDRILDQMDRNSRRYLKPSERSIDVYGLIVGNQREQFIKDFGKKLEFSIWALEIVIGALVKDKKTQTLDGLKSALLESYPSGKINAAITSTFYFVMDAKELAALQSKSRYSFPSYFLARYYLQSRDFETAHKYIIKALGVEKDSSFELQYLFRFEEVCRRCSCELPHDYDDRIKKILKDSKGSAATELLNTLGQHYLKSGDKRKGLRFLEAYLAQKPYEDKVRWTCAYEYSEVGEVALSLHHYAIYVAHNPEEHMAINNVAVAYAGKGLHIAALEKFREAYKLGNTLAGANIAARYINVGMVDDAKKMLDEMIASHPSGDYDDSVAAHLGSIVSARKQEAETRQRWESESGLLSSHNIQAVKATVKYSDSVWVGYWDMIGECAFECSIDSAGKVQVVAVNQGVLEAEFTVTADEGCLEVGRFKKPYANEYYTGILYLADINAFKGYLRDQYGEHKMVEGKRITDIDDYKEKRNRGLKGFLGFSPTSA
jgi:serine/threonine protein kinase